MKFSMLHNLESVPLSSPILSEASNLSPKIVVYFHLYGIERDDVDRMMETFPIVKHKDEKLYGERVILEMYDDMRRAMEMGEVYRTRLVPGNKAMADVCL
jgi:hypothetical protein